MDFGEGISITKEQKVTEKNEIKDNNSIWEYTFEDLPKLDDYGDEIEYTVNEKDLNNIFYIKSEVDQETMTVTNKFQVPGDTIDIEVKKIWDDNENKAGKRPTSITLQIKNGDKVVSEEVVSEEYEWKHVFTVPKYDENGNEISYTIDELPLENIFYTDENKVIDNENRTITNKFEVPDTKQNIKVTKKWDDNSNIYGKRPEKVTMILTISDVKEDTMMKFTGLIGKQFVKELTKENEVEGDKDTWEYTFEDLPVYDENGDVLEYELTEYVDSIYYEEVPRFELTDYTIINKFKVPDDKISIPVIKIWDDNSNSSGKRPENVTLVLTGDDGSKPYKVTLSKDNVDIVSNDMNKWLYTFDNLPKYNSVNGDEIKYTLSEEKVDSNYYTDGVVNNDEKTVTNSRKESKVIVHHYIIGTEEKVPSKEEGKVVEDEEIVGYAGDSYLASPSENASDDYDCVEVVGDMQGEIKPETTEVTFYYIRKASVRVEYVNKINNEKLADDVIISGHENDKYQTEQKEFEGYDFIEVVGNTEGVMNPDEEIVVTYYYLKPAKVITRYLEEETEEELSEETVIEGHEGESYKTEPKEIDFYKLSKSPDNEEGQMKDTIYVTYYYQKKIVDFGIDKTIGSIEINGKSQKINDNDLSKAEVYRKSISSTNIKITYIIKVTNKGEIEGEVTLLEKIPEYLTMEESDNPDWEISGKEARFKTDIINKGESKTYEVVMRWKKGDGHFGMQTNIVKIEDVSTPSGFEEENLQNNSDDAEVMISISTGVEKITGALLVILIFLLIILYLNRKLLIERVKIKGLKEEK